MMNKIRCFVNRSVIGMKKLGEEFADRCFGEENSTVLLSATEYDLDKMNIQPPFSNNVLPYIWNSKNSFVVVTDE